MTHTSPSSADYNYTVVRQFAIATVILGIVGMGIILFVVGRVSGFTGLLGWCIGIVLQAGIGVKRKLVSLVDTSTVAFIERIEIKVVMAQYSRCAMNLSLSAKRHQSTGFYD